MSYDKSRVDKVVELLKKHDTEEIKFYQTKKMIISQGYSEQELMLGLYEFPYDGVANSPKEKSELQKVFEKHPETAVAFVATQDYELNRRENTIAAANYLVSHQNTPWGYRAKLAVMDHLGFVVYFSLIYFLRFSYGLVTQGLDTLFETLWVGALLSVLYIFTINVIVRRILRQIKVVRYRKKAMHGLAGEFENENTIN